MKMSAEQKAEAVRRYGEGEKLKGIVAGMGFNWRTVKAALVAAGVQKRRQTTSRRHQFDERFFREIDTEAKAYWLGFLTADGHMGRGLVVEVGLQEADAEHLKKLAAAVGWPGEVRLKPLSGGRHKAELRLCSMAMIGDLAAAGCTHPGTSRVPPKLPPELVRHYLRGLFDGDGGIHLGEHKGRPQASISQCGTEACVRLFREWACRVSGSKANALPRRGIWYFETTGNGVCRRIMDGLFDGATVALDRKRVMAHDIWDFQ